MISSISQMVKSFGSFLKTKVSSGVYAVQLEVVLRLRAVLRYFVGLLNRKLDRKVEQETEQETEQEI